MWAILSTPFLYLSRPFWEVKILSSRWVKLYYGSKFKLRQTSRCLNVHVKLWFIKFVLEFQMKSPIDTCMRKRTKNTVTPPPPPLKKKSAKFMQTNSNQNVYGYQMIFPLKNLHRWFYTKINTKGYMTLIF